MQARSNKHVKILVKHYVAVTVIVAILSVILINLVSSKLKLNADNYYTGVVTLSTGAMVAIFLAVFYSDAARIQYIRQQVGAFQLFFIVLVDLVVAVATGLLIDVNRSANMTAIVILTVILIDLLWIITRLVYLALKAVK
jgi:hypothetical protein